MQFSYQLRRTLSIAILYSRKVKYYFLSDYGFWLQGRNQAVLFKNHPNVTIGSDTIIGVEQSPYFFSGYSYIDCRLKTDSIIIGSNCHFNNNLVLIARGANIFIGDNCLFGSCVSIINSDFHDLTPLNRFTPTNIKSEDVSICSNVFIGNDVKILKGVCVGTNSIIAAGSIVTRNIPSNVIAAGNPAKVIMQL